MNYIGSKYKLLSFIDDTIRKYVGVYQDKCFYDYFAGTGIVSKYFSDKFKYVVANDAEYYSYILNSAYLKDLPVIDLDILNSVEPVEGFIFNQYSEGGSAGRLYFSKENGMKIDGILAYIETLPKEQQIYAKASLIEASDKVANTASVYGAYLKKLKASALKPIKLLPVERVINKLNSVFNCTANNLNNVIAGDVLYLDPPYNNRQYSSNYHLLNTIARNDRFEPIGKTGQRQDNFKSNYCNKKAKEQLEDLIKKANFKYIFMSYNNEGIISQEDIKDIFSKYGRYEVETTDYKSYKADSKRDYVSDKTIEYIHCLFK